MKQTPDFMQNATNVYRTPHFIVRQRLSVLCSEEENNAVISRDTFYKRTPARNAEYEEIFKKREQIDGKRLPSSGYIREYRE